MRTTATPSLLLPLLGGLRRGLPAPAVQDAITPVPDHVAVGPTARVLHHVKRRGKNLAIWLRQPKNAAAFDGLKTSTSTSTSTATSTATA